jgi:hypothetical protein
VIHIKDRKQYDMFAPYGGDENAEKAKKHGVEVASPTMGSQPHTISLVYASKRSQASHGY